MSEQVTNFQFSRQPNMSPDDIESVIGPTLVIRGEVTAEEDLLIMGRVEGRIDHNQTLKIHTNGSVRAVVKAKNIQVDGEVEGDMYGTERVNICATGKVVGNVFAPRVGLMEGATFKGMVDMDSDAAAVESRFAEQASRNRPTPIGSKAQPVAAQAAPDVKDAGGPEQAAAADEARSDDKNGASNANRKKGAVKSDTDKSSHARESDENTGDAGDSASSDK